jgi:hypothetical protein
MYVSRMTDPHAPTAQECFAQSPFLSLKHSSYFAVYDELFGPYRGRAVTFVEVGVLNGGSLHMWRRFLGPAARIIGVDLNEGARRWEADGFEIAVGDQGDPAFWTALFARSGPVDVLLDDGGHTNRQQIVTVEAALPHVRDGGLVVVEDVHASFLPEFGNPSPWSFAAYVGALEAQVHARFPALAAQRGPATDAVYAVTTYESIVALRVDRRRCAPSAPVTNRGRSLEAADLRLRAVQPRGLVQLVKRVAGAPDSWTGRLVRRLAPWVAQWRLRRENARMRRHFP